MERSNLIRKISLSLDKLRKSERKVAEYILADPAKVINMRIIDLANGASVSEPTVIRFCRALDFEGFQAFKLKLAQHIGSSGNFRQFQVSPDDSIADVNKKVFDATIGSLINVRDEIDTHALKNAIDALSTAKRVEFYGFGASGSVAIDAQHKFFRLQVSAAAYTDPHIQHMSAISLKPTDVIVAISQSGRSKALIQSVKLAREAGATVIGLAPENTDLSDLCDFPIHINMEENHLEFTPVSSRIAHLVVIDVLAMGVAQHRNTELKEHLKRLSVSLRSLRTRKKSK
ncbi:SIS domain-containing protein [Haliea sp. AH-315-K21]|uniref:Transcriptional regulator n=1 Tax=SAR86 cluster bacterium TaxID=2030880 RepID=A0A2A5CI65_9GAMM|nr:SIS domain-containing protein [Haliea sp. AH-315-K21]PCJ43569.1 MAG: transcriptional regulator [SAR86 cluster bacterium]